MMLGERGPGADPYIGQYLDIPQYLESSGKLESSFLVPAVGIVTTCPGFMISDNGDR